MVAGIETIAYEGRVPDGSMEPRKDGAWAEEPRAAWGNLGRTAGGREEPQPRPRPEPAPPDPDPRPPMPKPPASLVLAALEHGPPSVVAIIPSA